MALDRAGQAPVDLREKAQLRIGRGTAHNEWEVRSTAEPEERNCYNPRNFNGRKRAMPAARVGTTRLSCRWPEWLLRHYAVSRN